MHTKKVVISSVSIIANGRTNTGITNNISENNFQRKWTGKHSITNKISENNLQCDYPLALVHCKTTIASWFNGLF